MWGFYKHLNTGIWMRTSFMCSSLTGIAKYKLSCLYWTVVPSLYKTSCLKHFNISLTSVEEIEQFWKEKKERFFTVRKKKWKKNETNPQIISADPHGPSPALLVSMMLCLTVVFSVALPEKAGLGMHPPNTLPCPHTLSKSLLPGTLALLLEHLTGKEEQI